MSLGNGSLSKVSEYYTVRDDYTAEHEMVTALFVLENEIIPEQGEGQRKASFE